MITRNLAKNIIDSIKPGFVTVIYGPRRIGKTVLLNQVLNNYKNLNKVVFNGDNEETRDVLSSTSQTVLSNAVEKADIIAVDEAQRIENIAPSLKIIIDKYPKKLVFVTKSSSIDTAKGLKETLAGRTTKFKLYPLSIAELQQTQQENSAPYILQNQLIYGGYPYLTSLSSREEKAKYLKSLVEDYVFKDILLLKKIERPDTLKKLARLLAFQVGSLVSITELANTPNIDAKTVKRYITTLKQGYIIFEVGSYSTNLRKELGKAKKYYFYDLGIKNALTSQFFSLDSRTDIGGLWENFLVCERLKKQQRENVYVKNYFWRSYEQQEIEWVEADIDNNLSAFDFKYNKNKASIPKSFYTNYNTKVVAVSKQNYLDFVT